MWTYWYLQEGEISVDPKLLSLPDGSMPPVLHVDSDAPLYDDKGRLITDELWGNYFKQDLHGVQGGAAPLIVGHEFEVDPYPTASVDSSFADMWCASLSHCMERFEGKRGTLRQRALGRRRLLHRGQLPGVRLHASERVRRRGLQPRLQDDRRRPRDLPRAGR